MAEKLVADRYEAKPSGVSRDAGSRDTPHWRDEYRRASRAAASRRGSGVHRARLVQRLRLYFVAGLLTAGLVLTERSGLIGSHDPRFAQAGGSMEFVRTDGFPFLPLLSEAATLAEDGAAPLLRVREAFFFNRAQTDCHVSVLLDEHVISTLFLPPGEERRVELPVALDRSEVGSRLRIDVNRGAPAEAKNTFVRRPAAESDSGRLVFEIQEERERKTDSEQVTTSRFG